MGQNFTPGQQVPEGSELAVLDRLCNICDGNSPGFAAQVAQQLAEGSTRTANSLRNAYDSQDTPGQKPATSNLSPKA